MHDDLRCDDTGRDDGKAVSASSQTSPMNMVALNLPAVPAQPERPSEAEQRHDANQAMRAQIAQALAEIAAWLVVPHDGPARYSR